MTRNSIRAGLRGILRAQFGFEVVGECPDGGAVPAAVDALTPDVVLMDVRMPLVDGVTATRRLRSEGNATPVLALTTFDDDEVLAGMLRAGAAGFILKGIPAEDLQRAVRVVAEGGAWLDPGVTARVLATYRSAPVPTASEGAELAALTGRELEVLTLIGAGRTNAEIARALFVGEGTVKTHVNHVFAKLRLRDRAAAVIFALDHNLTSRPLSQSEGHRFTQWSARMEDDGDRPGRSRFVLGPGQVPVEDPADRVAGQVLQNGIDDQPVGSGRPRPGRAPAATTAPPGRPRAVPSTGCAVRARRPAGSGRAGRDRAGGRR